MAGRTGLCNVDVWEWMDDWFPLTVTPSRFQGAPLTPAPDLTHAAALIASWQSSQLLGTWEDPRATYLPVWLLPIGRWTRLAPGTTVGL